MTYTPTCPGCRASDATTFYVGCSGCQARRAQRPAAPPPAISQAQVEAMDSTMQPLQKGRKP